MSKDEDEIIRDMIINTASHVDTSNFDGPTILTLYDTICVLEKKNPNWIHDKLCQMIFAWQSSLFLEDHVKEVCNSKCPNFLPLCLEYREYKTIMGFPLPENFGLEAFEFIFPQPIPDFENERFGCSPVRNCYFEML